jgi:nucleoside-triphosphatase
MCIRDRATGQRKLFARYQKPGDIVIGRYGIIQSAVEFANEAIMSGVNCDLLIIDELGHLELSNQGLTAAFEAVDLRGTLPSLSIVQRKYLENYIQIWGEPQELFKVTKHNRDHFDRDIFQLLIA